MSYTIPMELNAVDSTIESAAELAASIQRVLLETQDNIQNYVADQQSISAYKKHINQRFLKQFHELRSIERKSAGIAKSLAKSSNLKTNDVAHELGLKIAVRDMLQDIISIKKSYHDIQQLLVECKIMSFLSFATKRQLKKIYKSLDNSIRHTKSIQRAINKLNNYSKQEYLTFKAQYSSKTASMTNEPLSLHSDDMEFIFASIGQTRNHPTAAMQQALENYGKIS